MFPIKLNLTVAVVVVAWVLVPGGEVPAQERKKTGDPKDAATIRGTLAAVDAEKDSVTLTIHSFDRKTGEQTDTNKTFTVTKETKILQDDAPTKLADLKKGNPVTVKLDQTTALSV